MIALTGVSPIVVAGQNPSPQKKAFDKNLYDQIGARWYRKVEAAKELINVGAVRIAFSILPNGKITNLHVISNTSNQTLELLTLNAIRESISPPVPRELLTNGRYDVELNFNVPSH